MDFETVVHGGRIVTSEGEYEGDIGIVGGRIAAIAEKLSGGEERIDASGRIVCPGGVEGHAHIAQESAAGMMTADDYYSGTVSAAYGGNTTIIPFAAQHRGESIDDVIKKYDERGADAVIDFSYHLIVSDPTDEVIHEQLPRAFEKGITSFKVFTTYDRLNLGDEGMLKVLEAARGHGAITMVHAENDAMIKWMNGQLLSRSLTQPKYHSISRPELAEEEAIHRVIQLAKLADAPLFIVHVSTEGGADIVRREKFKGARLFAETCPQYLALTRDIMDRPGMEGAKFICSPPLRGAETQRSLWKHIKQGTFESVSSDHAPYRFDESGKLAGGSDVPYQRVANGMPGVAARLPYLFSEGVVAGRISLEEFVALSSTNAAQTFGCDTKGRIAPGMDADLAIWNPEKKRVIRVENQHDNMDYTPFEGMELTGVPETVICRGNSVIRNEEFVGRRSYGKFLSRSRYKDVTHSGYLAPEFDNSTNFGADLR